METCDYVMARSLCSKESYMIVHVHSDCLSVLSSSFQGHSLFLTTRSPLSFNNIIIIVIAVVVVIIITWTTNYSLKFGAKSQR